MKIGMERRKKYVHIAINRIHKTVPVIRRPRLHSYPAIKERPALLEDGLLGLDAVYYVSRYIRVLDVRAHIGE